MPTHPLFRQLLAGLLIANLLLASGCGYLLYPERQGLKGGRVDPVVVLLDAAGLLFYIVPGIIAFAVDFTNGTIYIPPGGQSALDKHTQVDMPQNPQKAGWQAVPVEGELTRENIAKALGDALGRDIAAELIPVLPQGEIKLALR